MRVRRTRRRRHRRFPPVSFLSSDVSAPSPEALALNDADDLKSLRESFKRQEIEDNINLKVRGTRGGGGGGGVTLDNSRESGALRSIVQ